MKKHKACKQYKPTTKTSRPKTKTQVVTVKNHGATVTKTNTVTDRTVTETVTTTTTTAIATVTVTLPLGLPLPTITLPIPGLPITLRDAEPEEEDAFVARAPVPAAEAEAKATQAPLPVPPFANKVCKGYAQYSSACACRECPFTICRPRFPTNMNQLATLAPWSSCRDRPRRSRRPRPRATADRSLLPALLMLLRLIHLLSPRLSKALQPSALACNAPSPVGCNLGTKDWVEKREIATDDERPVMGEHSTKLRIRWLLLPISYFHISCHPSARHAALP
jgi:hypothetical protein